VGWLGLSAGPWPSVPEKVNDGAEVGYNTNSSFLFSSAEKWSQFNDTIMWKFFDDFSFGFYKTFWLFYNASAVLKFYFATNIKTK
jgi:hypothetical protein